MDRFFLLVCGDSVAPHDEVLIFPAKAFTAHVCIMGFARCGRQADRISFEIRRKNLPSGCERLPG